MPRRVLGVLMVVPALAVAQQAPPPDRASHHVFTLAQFTFENGTTVPNVTVVYGTYGRLNARKDNVILLPSHYLADHHGYDWLIGPGLALDTSRYFLVATELFGNGHSSSPSNTPGAVPRAALSRGHDPRQRRGGAPATDDLGVTHLVAVIGFSMGAEQAFQ